MNLKYGIPSDCSELTCTAGVGTLLLEFGILGKLTGDPKFEHVAREALDSLWKYRSNSTGLFGKFIHSSKLHRSGLPEQFIHRIALKILKYLP